MENNTSFIEHSSSFAIKPVMQDGELRIKDINLAQRLGFARPRKIRELIARHYDALSEMGTCPTVGRVINGGKTEEYYLNRKQAIFITAKSETKEATEITVEIIERFDAYERGKISTFQIPQTFAEALRLAADQAEEIKVLQPKAQVHDLLVEAIGTECLTDAAKSLQVSPKKFFEWLRDHGWIFKRIGDKEFKAYSDKIVAGYLVHKEREIGTDEFGDPKIRPQVRVTKKGLAKLAQIFSSPMAAE